MMRLVFSWKKQPMVNRLSKLHIKHDGVHSVDPMHKNNLDDIFPSDIPSLNSAPDHKTHWVYSNNMNYQSETNSNDHKAFADHANRSD